MAGSKRSFFACEACYFLRILVLALLSGITACAPHPSLSPEPRWSVDNALIPDSPDVINDDLDPSSLLNAVDRSIEGWNKRIRSGSLVAFGKHMVPAEKVESSLRNFRSKLSELGLNERFFSYIKENYLLFRSAADTVLFTGYYEPLLHGSRTPVSPYCYPLLAKPDDLVSVDLSRYSLYSKLPGMPKLLKGRLGADGCIVPYYSRAEIDFEGKLSGKGLELLWVDDPIQLFFLHIQGSGIVQLPDGERVRVGYADKNGHTYRAIGRYLVDSGFMELETVSLQSIRNFLCEHPDMVPAIFSYNPSYVFFRILKGNGPLGSFGVPLTAGRSIACDPELFPPGALALIESEKPVFDETGAVCGWRKFQRFVLNQDSGGAIRGPGRVDLFTGAGAQSEWAAGTMRQPGTFFFMIEKEKANTPGSRENGIYSGLQEEQ